MPKQRIILIYLGRNAIGRHQYRKEHYRRSNRYAFDSLLFPYRVPNSRIKAYEIKSGVVGPFSLLPPRVSRKRKGLMAGERIFALKNNDPDSKFDGQFMITDPVSEARIFIKEISLLQIWDVHFERMEDHFRNKWTFIYYLSEKEISQLNF